MVVNRLHEGRRIVGTMMRFTRNPGICQIAKAAGLDYVMYDMEHGDYSMETFADAAMIAHSIGLGIFVRVPELSKAYVSRVLDLGADGVMVPMISSKEEAEKLVDWAKYLPQGKRGLSTIGSHTGMVKSPLSASQFMEEQNQNILVIAQIETAQGIANIDQIAAVPGLDVLLIGPNDLSVSLGVPGDMMGQTVNDAILKVSKAAKNNGITFAMHAGDNLLERWLDQGMNMVMNNMDIHLIYDGLKGIADKYKD
ncbi:hypothetical protein EXM22_17215 [Oceanispirochaeta crateris]|uniref:HpcH/HpaI aldolase/citrate lyase domain-containing protein n=1 Tax=Oceanispirochaeta crateris TaxID=2518645 RepID=A0A5C1QQJ4_9SPIO|nr:aldolase/citrate lyase family protein [Oceanispirochaeta crateris]QEN09638.1 hypothetical protein EXM22_17215 [Oceanispirochaeta crateris]